MKTVQVILIVVISTHLTGFQAPDKKEKRASEQLEMAQLIQKGKFRFVARTANSELGSFNNLSGGYEVKFDSTRIEANLPYFGRAYVVPYGGDGGVKFDLVADKLENQWNERKKMYTVSATLKNSDDTYSLKLTMGLDGFANLQINFRNRRWISYFGTIEKIVLNEGNKQ